MRMVRVDVKCNELFFFKLLGKKKKTSIRTWKWKGRKRGGRERRHEGRKEGETEKQREKGGKTRNFLVMY